MITKTEEKEIIKQEVIAEIKKSKYEEIEEEFDVLIDTLTDKEWWNWVRTWVDTDIIKGIYDDWDIYDKEEAIKDFKGIIKKRRKKKWNGLVKK